MAKNGLKFTGASLLMVGVPPRDLSHDEVEQYGGYELLLKSGLYKEVKTTASKKKKEVDNGNN